MLKCTLLFIYTIFFNILISWFTALLARWSLCSSSFTCMEDGSCVIEHQKCSVLQSRTYSTGLECKIYVCPLDEAWKSCLNFFYPFKYFSLTDTSITVRAVFKSASMIVSLSFSYISVHFCFV